MRNTDAYRVTLPGDSRRDSVALSAAIRCGNLLFLSGQVAMGRDGKIVGPGDFAAQVHQAFANIRRILEAAGSDLRKVVKTTTFVTDLTHVATWSAIKKRYLSLPYPAGTIVEVNRFVSREAMIEIEAVALVEGEIRT